MKRIETDEEMAFIEAVENGEIPMDDPERKKEQIAMLEAAAKRTIDKMTRRKPISIRIIEDDIPRLKAMAMREGMPYQTFITHYLHKLCRGEVKIVS
ncbi:hypothetical protein [Hydrogenimonas sp.]